MPVKVFINETFPINETSKVLKLLTRSYYVPYVLIKG